MPVAGGGSSAGADLGGLELAVADQFDEQSVEGGFREVPGEQRGHFGPVQAVGGGDDGAADAVEAGVADLAVEQVAGAGDGVADELGGGVEVGAAYFVPGVEDGVQGGDPLAVGRARRVNSTDT